MYPIKQEIILKLKEADRLGVEAYPIKQEIILKLKGAERLGAEVYPIKQEIILKLKEADHRGVSLQTGNNSEIEGSISHDATSSILCSE